jgi:membrane protease YdiL (CAAX protease family)
MAIAAWIIAGILGVIALAAVLEGDQTVSDLSGRESIAVSLPVALGIAAAALLLAAPGGDPFRALRLRNWRWRDIPLGMGLGAAAQFLLIPLYIPILWIFDGDVSEAAQDLSDKFSDNEMWLLVVLVLIIAPVTEELFYRGLIQGSLERSLAPWMAVSVSSLIFGLVHFQLLQLPGLIFIGAVTGYSLYRTNRLSMSIGVHMGFNGVATVLLLVDRFG